MSILFGIIYFLPTIIVSLRMKDPLLIFILNLLFAWTIIGWILCLIFSFLYSEDIYDSFD